MKKEARLLLQKSCNSLVLAIELFNRPWDNGRKDSVLILLDHAFEMLLKAGILHKGGKIREKRAQNTHSIKKCIQVSLNTGKINFLGENQALTIQAINSLRDAAQHHLVDIPESILYITAQAGVTLYRDIYQNVFQLNVAIDLPQRVLPLSTTLPMDLIATFSNEINEIKKLLNTKSRKKLEARAKLRALTILDLSLQGQNVQPDNALLKTLSQKIIQGKSMEEIFPAVACINLTQKGQGPSLDLRIVKKGGIPVEIIKDSTAETGALALKRVNELEYYCMSPHQIAANLKVSQPKFLALVKDQKIRENPDYYKKFKRNSIVIQGYSQNALVHLKALLPTLNMEEVWQKHKPTGKRAVRYASH